MTKQFTGIGTMKKENEINLLNTIVETQQEQIFALINIVKNVAETVDKYGEITKREFEVLTSKDTKKVLSLSKKKQSLLNK